jgi:cytidylate kinase
MNLPLKYIIAIDGYSSCGKSTIAKDIANALNFIYIDTGAMYRAVTLFAIENNIFSENNDIDENLLQSKITSLIIEFEKKEGHTLTLLNGDDISEKIRSPKVSDRVSLISKLKFVREHLVAMQREMGKKGRVVLDGRDIGTVVFPNADLKIFMTASIVIRTQRRFEEMKAKYPEISLAEVQQNLQERDRIDTTREESPLRQAEDAKVLDNSELTRDGQLQLALLWINNTIEI